MNKKDKNTPEAKLYLIQRFQSWEYLMKKDRPQCRSVTEHLQKLVKLTQSDINSFNRNIDHLTKTYQGFTTVPIDFEGAQFIGLTNEQMKECSMINEYNFELIEIDS